MLQANYVEPPVCSLCDEKHEKEYPHVINAAFKFRFFNRYKHQPTTQDSYSHCKGLIFECAEIVHKKDLNYGNRPASGGGE